MSEIPESPGVWLVDGFNVLHALLAGPDRGDWWGEASRRRLLERLGGFDDPAAEIWVVFDGNREATEPTAAPGRLRSVFAPSADAWLLRRLREYPDPSAVAVVTRDRRLADRLRHRGARVCAPHRFLARCPEP